MTLIVGIVCSDGIVVAGDSQTTGDTFKILDTNKINHIQHSSGHALVAEAGVVTLTSNMVEELGKLVRDKNMSDQHSFSDLVKMAVRKTRDAMRYQNFDCNSEELENVIVRNELQSVLLYAHYDGESPKLHTISLSMGIPQPAKKCFDAVGTGSALAHYLLTNLCVHNQQMDVEQAAVLAVHVVETVKRHDRYCEGPTRLGILRAPRQDGTGEVLTVEDRDGVIYSREDR